MSQAAVDLLELGSLNEGHVYGRVPLRAEPVPSAAAWPLRVTARRGIRRILRAAGQVDLLHLRMADVGSLAAADVARELGIPVVFTVAPDPHAVIQSLDRAGSLTREHFGEVDLREHFWFRARLVQNLASNAAHTVLFPRPQLQRDMSQLVGIDITSHPERHTIVAEGVDLEVIDARRRRGRAQRRDGAALRDLRVAPRRPAREPASPAVRRERRAPAPREGHGDARRRLGARRPARPRQPADRRRRPRPALAR